MAKYGWVLTKDHISDPDEECLEGTCGPSSVTREQVRAAWMKGKLFRMKDDDGEVCVEGRISGDYDGFEPLDDYGTGALGCTSIEYRDKTGAWDVL